MSETSLKGSIHSGGGGGGDSWVKTHLTMGLRNETEASSAGSIACEAPFLSWLRERRSLAATEIEGLRRLLMARTRAPRFRVKRSEGKSEGVRGEKERVKDLCARVGGARKRGITDQSIAYLLIAKFSGQLRI